MGSIRLILVLVFSVFFTIGCANSSWRLPKTPGDLQSAPSYGYTPIDPLPVTLWYDNNDYFIGKLTNDELLELLPDETMRIAIGQIQRNGSITYGLAKAGIAGNSYVVILDYVKFTTEWTPVDITETAGQKTATVSESKISQVTVPVYIGVGLRLTANVIVNEGSVDLGNLIALGAAAQAKQVSGTMVVQTLGISGENISGIIPMPSEINPSTIQNAILSLGAIKAKIYAAGTKINARVVGVYNNLGGGQDTINSFISSILRKGIPLYIKRK